MAKVTIAGRPKVACELTTSHVFVARAGEKGAGIVSMQARPLPGVVEPSLMNPNVTDAPALTTVLNSLLQDAGARAKDVVVVVPDAAVRVVLLDFDTLPDRKVEADAVVRFRLKKALPFDVDRAAISYHAQSVGTTLKVIVAVMMNSVLAEYESVVRDAGYQPGVILPSTLAALGNIESDRPTMVVKITEGSTTIAILNKNQLSLYRSLDHGSSTVTGEILAEDIYPSVVFFQDTYKVPIEKVYLAGVHAHDVIAKRLAQETSAPVEELVAPAFAGIDLDSMPKGMLAGLLGALAQ